MTADDPQVEHDERFKIEADPEDTLRGLLRAEPDTQAREAALQALRAALPNELELPGHRDALITNARMAGAGMDEIRAALDSAEK